ncbi:Multidrug resistance protein MdtL [Streptomyces avidinii]
MTTAPATAAAPPVIDRRRRNVIFGTIMLGVLLAALDQTIVGTALPTIVGDLGGGDHMSWVVTSYLLAETVATVLVGKFGDLFGRKLIFQISAVVFISGSFLCGLSSNMTFLIVWRGVQGIGAGGLMVTAMALIADVVPLRERGKYQGMIRCTRFSECSRSAATPRPTAPSSGPCASGSAASSWTAPSRTSARPA